MNAKAQEEVIELANALIESRLDPRQRIRLEEIIENSSEARRLFADFMHDHAALYWSEVAEEPESADGLNWRGVRDIPAPGNPATPTRALTATTWGLAAVFAISAAGLVWWFSRAQASPGFAEMKSTQSARWESGDLPTAEGARLGPGHLRLAEGLATLNFDSGAELIMEAPAEIFLVDAMKCVLTEGTAVADIPESAIGFRIETPSVHVVDYGTRFAVNVDSSTGATRTQVFEGLVEVEQPESGEVVALRSGQRNLSSGGSLGSVIPGLEEGDWATAKQPLRRGDDWTTIETTRDAYVHSIEVAGHISDVLLLLKNSSDSEGPHRKAYLGFDFSTIEPASIEEAELTLEFSPTGWGLASAVPDATFGVYGLRDTALDDWNESEISWESAPANLIDQGAGLDPVKVMRLGSFVVPQGVQRGAFSLKGAALVEFLQDQARDRFATLIVVRETRETDGSGLVHGIASHRHAGLPGPTLAVRLRQEE